MVAGQEGAECALWSFGPPCTPGAGFSTYDPAEQQNAECSSGSPPGGGVAAGKRRQEKDKPARRERRYPKRRTR